MSRLARRVFDTRWPAHPTPRWCPFRAHPFQGVQEEEQRCGVDHVPGYGGGIGSVRGRTNTATALSSAGLRGRSSAAEHQLPKLRTRVRFPSPAPTESVEDRPDGYRIPRGGMAAQDRARRLQLRDDLVRDRTTHWDGVTNTTAQMHTRAMQVGDRVGRVPLAERQGGDRARRGGARPYPDPTDPAGKRVWVDIRAGRRLDRPVTLGRE